MVLIGIDGLEWRLLAPLLRDGRLPHLARLLENGSAGQLLTFEPTLSPVIWTSAVTGVRPDRHGIDAFLDPNGVPYTSASRRVRALWNIAGEYGLKTLSVGWWMTWPAEEIDGWMVAPYSSGGQRRNNWKGNLRRDLADQTWPRELIDEVFPIAERLAQEEAFRALDQPFFGGVDLDGLSGQERQLVAQTRWSIAADATFAAIARHLLEKPEVSPDLTLVYLGGTDVASHRFWRYRWPEEFSYEVPADSTALFRETIERFYVEADRMLGEILAAAPEQADVILCSDHGFHSSYTEAPHPEGLSGHHLDAPPGVVILSGPSFRKGAAWEAIRTGQSLPPLGRVDDLAPLVLYLLGIPLAEQMASPDGGGLLRTGVAEELLIRRPPVPGVANHDSGFRRGREPAEVSPEVTAEIEDWMRRLGYLGK